jgi:hypothetical protein
MELADWTISYLEADRYEVTARGRDLLVGRRSTLAEDTEFIYVWIPPVDPAKGFASLEGPYMAKFEEVNRVHPFAPKYLLLPNLQGITSTFREGSRKWYNVKIRVPVQFFDTPFRWEESREASSAVRDAQRAGASLLKQRAFQPFSVDGNVLPEKDVLDALRSSFVKPQVGEKPIRIVVGPAGVGKSFMFDSLLAILVSNFVENKRAQRAALRPLPLLSQYLNLAEGFSVRALLRAYLQSDFVRTIDVPIFEWMLLHGTGAWLLDGLDELIAQDVTFLHYLGDLITRPKAETPPNVLICVRDSLLASNENFREFCSDYRDYVSIYRLEKWGLRSKQEFARLNLDANKAGDYLGKLRSNSDLDQLASTPYYSRLLTDLFEDGRLSAPLDETHLLDQAMSALLERDYSKGFVSKSVLTASQVIDFVEAVAAEDMERGFTGVPIQDVRELAEIALPATLTTAEISESVSGLTKLAFFGYASLGQIQFSQELLEHYLLGHWLVRQFDNHAEAFVRALGRYRFSPNWITTRVLVEHLGKIDGTDRLAAMALQSVNQVEAFRNLTQLLALTFKRPGQLRDLPFERHDLSGVVFEGLDLSLVSFRASDLTDAEFRSCTLSGASFEDAILRNTAFVDLPESALHSAEVGNLARFYSIRVDRNRHITHHSDARKWFEDRIGKQLETLEPCPAALQLRNLCLKFVRPDGQARRSWLDNHGVVSGARALDPRLVLEAAVSHGYFEKDPRRQRIVRTDGAPYSEIVAYVVGFSLTPGISALLNEVCDRPQCNHVPEVPVRQVASRVH